MKTGSTRGPGVGLAALGVTLSTALGLALGTGPASAAEPSAYHNGFLRLGNPNARVVVSITEDFACPACRAFETTSGPTLATLINDGKVAVEYRTIALIDRNWAAVTHTDYSARSATAAACVGQADPAKFLAFHHALFAAQPPEGSAGPTNAALADTATATGSTAPDVSACILTQRYRPYVDSTTDVALGQILGTPTIRVNGAQVDDPTPANILAAIERAEGH
jgi:protein-disulfide isomerase